MINNCPHCNKTPKVNVDVSCQNIKCLNYDEKYFVWEWQELVKPGEGEVLIKDLSQHYEFQTTR